MTTPQRIIENLLLITAASRAVLRIARPDGGFAIEAEAVQHGQQQIRHGGRDTDLLDTQIVARLARGEDIVEDDITPADAPEAVRHDRVAARMLSPLIMDGQLVAVVSLHQATQRHWNERDTAAMLDARANIIGMMAHRDALEPPAREDLRANATQAVLDRLRIALSVQRCTFRQPVQDAYAFPVTFESRADGQRSLLGDFTIVQTGQPVIVKLLEGRRQVVQEDCSIASDDPLFHKMLAHYGGMRAQVVTPFIVGDQLKGVLSIHELRHPRAWTVAEKALAARAAALIGAMFEISQSAGG